MINLDQLIPEQFLTDIRYKKLLDFIKDQYDYYLSRILKLNTLFIPEETEYPYESSRIVATYISKYDTSDDIRISMSKAMHTHKIYGSFKYVWKPIIDEYLGGDSKIYDGSIVQTPFIVAQSVIAGSDLLSGFGGGVIVGKIAGTVYIDLDITPNLTQTLWLIEKLRPFKPAYFNVYIGNKVLYSTSPDIYTFKKVGKL